MLYQKDEGQENGQRGKASRSEAPLSEDCSLSDDPISASPSLAPRLLLRVTGPSCWCCAAVGAGAGAEAVDDDDAAAAKSVLSLSIPFPFVRSRSKGVDGSNDRHSDVNGGM